ncbi:MAG: hypothetical protein K0M45_07535 [Candidatus Paracaedibacteraceae bacterium]|nr:hypothetical protein [Candidatus Paracaedibacteraceae bacterium]
MNTLEGRETNDLTSSHNQSINFNPENVKGVRETDVIVKKGWYNARLLTPQNQVYRADHGEYQLYDNYDNEDKQSKIYLYHESVAQGKNSKSHARVAAPSLRSVSVDTSLRTPIQRRNQAKTTFIQYDKNGVRQEGADFQVDILNEYDQVNCDGGHLVDYKFSAQGSHTDAVNYVPQHYFYNRWLKEHLVKKTQGYLEIALYTPNPPQIKVKGEERYDPIPIGILLVTLSAQSIEAAYYFPNNKYNYRALQKDLEIKGKMAEQMVINFRLNQSLLQLLTPAIIYYSKTRGINFPSQLEHEAKGKDRMGNLVEGMGVLNSEDSEALISRLASNVFHEEEVDLATIFSPFCSAADNNPSNSEAIQAALDVLGKFLIEYGMKNVLKSEVVSTHSRIMFANIITDFIEAHHQVSEKAMDRIEKLFSGVYPSTLEELFKVRKGMTLTDLLYFGNLYNKLSSPHIHSAFFEGFKICEDMDLDDNLSNFISILKRVYRVVQTQELTEDQKQNLLDLLLDARDNIDYLVETEYPEEEFEDSLEFLKKSKKVITKWKKMPSLTKGTYQNSPNSYHSFRSADGYYQSRICRLGT